MALGEEAGSIPEERVEEQVGEECGGVRVEEEAETGTDVEYKTGGMSGEMPWVAGTGEAEPLIPKLGVSN